MKTPDQWEAEAKKHDAEAARAETSREESFERSDTDGFLSQWASGISASKSRIAAEIARNGGKAEFVGLFDIATGARIPAVLIETQYGYCWSICDAKTGQFVGKFMPSGPRSRKQKQAGMCERPEMADAYATIEGRGTGLSGQAWACAKRSDGGYPGRPGKR